MRAAKKMVKAVEPIPEGYHSFTPYLTVRGADRAIDFYKRGLGAVELGRMTGPDGKSILHSVLEIGDSRFFISDEIPGMGCRSPETLGGTCGGLYLYVHDVDEVFRKAIAAGAAEKQPVTDMFWGDRTGTIKDPFGYEWVLATHTEDVSPTEMKRRQEEFCKGMGGGKT